MKPPATTPFSLQARLSLAAVAVLLVFVALTGLALDRAFRQSMETALRERLQDRLYALLAIMDVDGEGRLHLARNLPDPRLARPGSGLYAQIETPDGRVLWRSPSLVGTSLPSTTPTPPGRTVFTPRQLNGQAHLELRYALRWETDNGRDVPLRIRIVADRAPWQARIAGYRRTLWGWLGGAALLLLLVQAAVLYWSLQPLRRISADLQRIERGEIDTLGGPHPRELQQLATRIDDLLAHNRQQLQRYRDALGNLAHSLKTPLAVLAHAVERPGERPPQEAREAVARIREIIDYQLQRAAAAGRGARSPLPLRPQLERLLATLHKVHGERAIDVELTVADALAVRMDRGDVLELFGNLLDNAFKWSRSRIRISAHRAGSDVSITIEDDGPGIPDGQKEAVRERGRRADAATEGHGIGLAMAQEIVLLYGGELDIGDSELGGARMTVILPG